MSSLGVVITALTCAGILLFGVLLIGGLALIFTIRNRRQDTAPDVTSISEAEAEEFITHFLGVMGHGNKGGDMMPLIAPSFVAKVRGAHTELRVNKFSIGAVKILHVDPPFVDVKISHHQPPRPRWAREQTYKLAREQGQLYIMPSGMGKYEYINPWWEDAPITRRQKLVFYALDDPDQEIEKATARFKARYLNGKQDFVADLAPAMVVEEKQAFLAGEYASVAGSSELSKQARTELQELGDWITTAPQNYIGFQIET
jgi:hypothetical protein